MIDRLGATSIADIERKIAEKKIEHDNIMSNFKRLEDVSKKKIDEYEKSKNLLKNLINNSQFESSDEIEILQRKNNVLSVEIHKNDPQLIKYSYESMEIKREIKKLEMDRQIFLNNSEKNDGIELTSQKKNSILIDKLHGKSNFDESCNSSNFSFDQEHSTQQDLENLTPELHITNTSNADNPPIPEVLKDLKSDIENTKNIDDFSTPKNNIISSSTSTVENLGNFINLTTPQAFNNLRNPCNNLIASVPQTSNDLKNEFYPANLLENKFYPELQNLDNIFSQPMPNYPFDKHDLGSPQMIIDFNTDNVVKKSVIDEFSSKSTVYNSFKLDLKPENRDETQIISNYKPDNVLENFSNDEILFNVDVKNSIKSDFTSNDLYNVGNFCIQKFINNLDADLNCLNDLNVEKYPELPSNNILIPELLYFNDSNTENLLTLESNNVLNPDFVSDDPLDNVELGLNTKKPLDTDNLLIKPQVIEVNPKLTSEISFNDKNLVILQKHDLSLENPIDTETLLISRNQSILSNLNSELSLKKSLSSDIRSTTQDSNNCKEPSDSLPDHYIITEKHDLSFTSDDLQPEKPIKNFSFSDAISSTPEKNNLHAENNSKTDFKSISNSTLTTDFVEECSASSANLTKALNLFENYLKEDEYIESDDKEFEKPLEVPKEIVKNDENTSVEEDKLSNDIVSEEVDTSVNNTELEKCKSDSEKQENGTKTDQIIPLNNVNLSESDIFCKKINMSSEFEKSKNVIFGGESLEINEKNIIFANDELSPVIALGKVDDLNEIKSLKVFEENIDFPEEVIAKVVNKTQQKNILESNESNHTEFVKTFEQITILKDNILSKFDLNDFIHIENAFNDLIKELSQIFEQDKSSIINKKPTEVLFNDVKNQKITDETTKKDTEKDMAMNDTFLDSKRVIIYFTIALSVITLVIIFFCFFKK